MIIEKDYLKNKLIKLIKFQLKCLNQIYHLQKSEKFGIKIAKDGILRSSSEILAQKGVKMLKLEKFGLIYHILIMK